MKNMVTLVLMSTCALFLSTPLAADGSGAPTAHIVHKDKPFVVHIVPATTEPVVWLGLGRANSALLTMTDLESGRMSVLFCPTSKHRGAKNWRDWSVTTMAYLDGVVCGDNHVFVFIITNCHWSTMHVQSIMKRDELRYSISVYAKDTSKLLSSIMVRPKVNRQHRHGRIHEELMKNTAGPLTLTQNGVSCFDRLFVMEDGQLKEEENANKASGGDGR